MRTLLAALLLLLATNWAALVWAQSAELTKAFNRQKELREIRVTVVPVPYYEKSK